VARHAGARVLAFSLITNAATGDEAEGANHAEVIEVGRIGAAKLLKLFPELLPAIAGEG
jgi:purine-nucleoside phosphorylase